MSNTNNNNLLMVLDITLEVKAFHVELQLNDLS